jgi:Phage Mu protein F like protein
MNEKQFLEALAKFAPEIQRAFIEAMQRITDDAILAQLIEAIKAGDAEAAYRAIGYQSSVLNRLVATLTTTFEHGGVMMASMPKYTADATGTKTALRFNIRDKRAEAWLAEQSSSLIGQVEDDIRVNVRSTLADGLAAGRNPNVTALDIIGRYNAQTGRREGGVIGLSQQQEGWARSARTKLETLDKSYFNLVLRDKRFDGIAQKAIDSGKMLPAETIERLITRYRDRALKYRGESIGRSETLTALSRSGYESVRQAMDQSDLPLAATTKEWDSAGDDHVRHSHAAMNGQKVGMDEPFISPVTGARMMHPGDGSLGAGANDLVMCRCHVKYKTDFSHGVE